MTPQDVIRNIERWKMVVRPCVAGKTWTAQTWLNGVLHEARRHANVTCAVRSLCFKLEGKTPDQACCGASDD